MSSAKRQFEENKIAALLIISFAESIFDDFQNISDLFYDNPEFFNNGKAGKPILKTILEKLKEIIEEEKYGTGANFK